MTTISDQVDMIPLYQAVYWPSRHYQKSKKMHTYWYQYIAKLYTTYASFRVYVWTVLLSIFLVHLNLGKWIILVCPKEIYVWMNLRPISNLLWSHPQLGYQAGGKGYIYLAYFISQNTSNNNLYLKFIYRTYKMIQLKELKNAQRKRSSRN